MQKIFQSEIFRCKKRISCTIQFRRWYDLAILVQLPWKRNLGLFFFSLERNRKLLKSLNPIRARSRLKHRDMKVKLLWRRMIFPPVSPSSFFFHLYFYLHHYLSSFYQLRSFIVEFVLLLLAWFSSSHWMLK